MRSFNSSSRQAVLSGEVAEFVEWAPETLPAREHFFATGASAQEAIDQAVADALEAEREAAAAREAELMERLEAQREEHVREAYERGHEEGRVEGERLEAARLRTAVNAAEEALDTLRAGEVRWSGTIEENVCALAVVVARQVIGRELKLDISPVQDLVRDALAEFPIDQPIRIRINPTDLNALGSIGAVDDPMRAPTLPLGEGRGEGLQDSLKRITGDREARWLPDSSIAPGGCIVEGRERIIDGRVDTALERVYRRITYTNA